MDDNRFRQMLRVDRTQFAHLLSLIENDDVFAKCSGKQFPVDIQLAVVLYRLGSSGESASIRKIASTFGIGDGGTLTKITRRVFKAFLKQLHLYIYWPDPTERSEIVRETFNELPFCVGYVDGTEIKLAEAPIKNHEAFFSRNHVYAIKAQMVCDYKRKIRDVVVGYSGSTHDAKIFKNQAIFFLAPFLLRFFPLAHFLLRLH
ncbi:Protein ANTAGONIST OF LIKE HETEROCHROMATIN PROTEIN 1 [Eumeta japonica]|uniref:Protein ANTAGONIST OF LIKE HETEROCHROMATIN PROTEIN 1 n=1 Tax=Eumeta variegata TaxID=151549 RepID=A0A4C1THN1_EUMVA|nr:Protein ANTAGONIST OF LIKE HETEROCHROMATIN PROTEIN 1 [Eumeta japonica]